MTTITPIDIQTTAKRIAAELKTATIGKKSGSYTLCFTDEGERVVIAQTAGMDGSLTPAQYEVYSVKDDDATYKCVDESTPMQYMVYCQFENEDIGYKYTEDLSLEALEKVLRNFATLKI